MSEGMVSAICIKWREKKIILVPNIDPAKPLGFWGLPGGKMKNGETPDEAAFRELGEETGQEGVIKYRAEILKNGSNGAYVHHFVFVKILPGKELKNCGDSGIGEPKWIPFEEIIHGRVKMFRGHAQGLILLLEKMAEGKSVHGKADRNGIPILSEKPPMIAELLDELKKVFDDKGGYVRKFVPQRLIRAGYRPFDD